MRSAILAALATTALCTPAFSATLTGNAFFVPRSDTGDLLNVGRADDGGSGSAILDESMTFFSGTDPDELVARPKIDVGEGETGTVTVKGSTTVVDLIGTGTGSKLEIGDDPGGDGTVLIRDGAIVRLTGDDTGPDENNVFVQFGEDGGTGEVTVEGGASLQMDGFDLVGILASSNGGSTGSFNVLNGSDVRLRHFGPRTGNGDTAYVFVGNGGFSGETGASNGTMLVDNSIVTINSIEGYANIRLGRNGGNGTATLSNGATMVLGGGTGSFIAVGADAGSSGRLVVEDFSFLNLSRQEAALTIGDHVPEFAQGTSGTGQVILQSGGRILINKRADDGIAVQVGAANINAGEFSLGSLSILGTSSFLRTEDIVQVGKISGEGTTTGILTVGDEGLLRAREVQIHEGGILTGNGGTVQATTIINTGGTLAVGASPGTMTFDGDLILSGGLLDIEIGATEFDFLDILGDLVVEDPFDINIRFLDDYVPQAGAEFDFFSVAGNIIGDLNLATVNLFGLNSDFTPVVSLSGGLSVKLAEDLTPIPLPAGLPMLLTGLGGIALLKRRKRKKAAAQAL